MSCIKTAGNGAKKNIPRNYHGMSNITGGVVTFDGIRYNKYRRYQGKITFLKYYIIKKLTFITSVLKIRFNLLLNQLIITNGTILKFTMFDIFRNKSWHQSCVFQFIKTNPFFNEFLIVTACETIFIYQFRII